MADLVSTYDDEIGWVRVDAVLEPADAADLARRCEQIADELDAPRSGDKPNGATRRLTALDERLPATEVLVDRLAPVVDQILTGGWAVSEIAYRNPGPDTGGQLLHADDLPRLDDREPYRCATAIVALVDLSADNGATRVVPGSHRRPDLQRQSQTVEHLPAEEYLTGPVGTAFVFCGHLLHAGSRNRSPKPRPVLQLSFRAGPGDHGQAAVGGR
jgi:ectoine hydroxylase-related dioxygenase (phytanoyl-CoA dioxygenase family)